MEAKQVKDLMEAYSSIYVQSEQEVLSEDLQGAVKAGLEKGAEFMKNNPVGKLVGAVIGPVGGSGRGTVTKAEQEAKIRANKQEEVQPDVFDTILEYLVAEGYADTNKAALAIMANMSEEWKQSIVEQMVVNVADVKGNTKAAQNAQAGMKNKVTGEPMYKPGVGVGPDFKLVKGV